MLEIIIAHEHVHQLSLAIHDRRNGAALLLQCKSVVDLCYSIRGHGARRQSCRLRRPPACQETPNDIRSPGRNSDWVVRGTRLAYSAHTAAWQHEHSRHPRGNPRIDLGKPSTVFGTLLLRRRHLLPEPVFSRCDQRGRLQSDAGSWNGSYNPLDFLQLVAPELESFA